MSRFDFGELSIQYGVDGKGAPALVFVHGLMGRRNLWAAQVEHFRANHFVFVIDVLGCGKDSQRGSPFETLLTAADAVSQLVKETVNLPYVAVGHSAAGLTLLRLLMLSDSLLTGAVFVDSPKDIPNRGFWLDHNLYATATCLTPVMIIDATMGTFQTKYPSLSTLFPKANYVRLESGTHDFFTAQPALLNKPLEGFLGKQI